MATRLRSLVFTIVLCLASYVCSAQWVAIPDSNFGTWLNTHGYTSCLQGNNTSGWQMDTTCNAVVSATSLTCPGANIYDITGAQYFDQLIVFQCNDNHISFLPPLRNQLQILNCCNNEITGTIALPTSLTALYCYNNQLTTLPAFPANLTIINCSINAISNLSTLPVNLNVLNCSRNGMSALPTLPSKLTELICNNNQLTGLPSLPDTLRVLNCSYNYMQSLTTLNTRLQILDCSFNPLLSLPNLNNSLLQLDCSNGNLQTLPALNQSLQELDCSGNDLAELPQLPNSLRDLNCSSNLLSELPLLPDTMEYLNCTNNFNLICLPELKHVMNFSFLNGTSITCLPNYPLSYQSGDLYSTSSGDAVPLCDYFNNFGCGIYQRINGFVFYDSLDDCAIREESGLPNIKVLLYEGGVLQEQVTTNLIGSYSFHGGYSTYHYSIDTTQLVPYVACPDSGSYTSTVTAVDSFVFDKDFGLRCKPGFDLEARSIEGRFVPGNVRLVYILAGDATNFYNVRCAAGISGAVTVTINGSANYTAPASGALTPTVNGNMLTYTVPDFGAINFSSAFNVWVQTDTTAVIGDTICITVSVTPTTGDNNPANNTITICFPVRTSYDPNDKTAYPAGDISTTQKEITYTVRFQNTGTAEAQHVYITDTLSQFIDEGSFQLLAYSHQPMVQIEQNRVRFNFPNINLPDSNTNEPLSHGYVQYKVKLKDNLPIGTTINNTAHIYFDFNAPVVTNTTTNTITTNTGIQQSAIGNPQFTIFPNPTNNSFTVSIPENLIGQTLMVTDITGKQMAAVQLQTVNSKLETAPWASGIYFVRMGNAVSKLIVQK